MLTTCAGIVEGYLRANKGVVHIYTYLSYLNGADISDTLSYYSLCISYLHSLYNYDRTNITN